MVTDLWRVSAKIIYTLRLHCVHWRCTTNRNVDCCINTVDDPFTAGKIDELWPSNL